MVSLRIIPGSGASDPDPHHGVADQVSQVTFLGAACRIGPVQEDQSPSYHRRRVIGQVLLPLIHLGQNLWI